MIEWKYVRHPTEDGNENEEKGKIKARKRWMWWYNMKISSFDWMATKRFSTWGEKNKIFFSVVVVLLNFWHRLNFVEFFRCWFWLWCHSYLFILFNIQFCYSFDDIMHSSHKHLTEYFPYLFPFHCLYFFSAIYDVIVSASMPAFVFVNHSVDGAGVEF